jgi:hypothetical protein
MEHNPTWDACSRSASQENPRLSYNPKFRYIVHKSPTLWTVTSAEYLNMLQESIVPAVRQLYGDEGMWYQEEGEQPHYHLEVRT